MPELSGGLGLLVLRGFLLRTIRFAERHCSEPLGPGDVVQPWERGGEHDATAFAVEWYAVEPTVFAVLDARFLPARAGTRPSSRPSWRARSGALMP